MDSFDGALGAIDPCGAAPADGQGELGIQADHGPLQMAAAAEFFRHIGDDDVQVRIGGRRPWR